MLPLLFILSVAFTGVTDGAGVLPEGPVDKAKGDSVIFNTTLTPTIPVLIVVWTFNSNNIINSVPAGNTTAPQYEDRITLFMSTGSLELRGLNESDSGKYGFNILPSISDLPVTGFITLRVHEAVSNVMLSPAAADLVEFNSSLELFCSSSGSSLSYSWMNGSSDVSDRVQITNGGANLTIVQVTRYDQGSYSCQVSNPVSSNSTEANVSVSFGPENVKVEAPDTKHFLVGSNITLKCSADSRPFAQFTWFLNGTKLADTGPELKLTEVSVNQSGSYTCQAFNTKTLRYQTSDRSDITVLEEISGASIKPTNKLVEGTSDNLTCEASGSVWTRSWTKNGLALVLGHHMNLYDNNRVLSFNTLTKADKGAYVCTIENPLRTVKAEFSLVVNYGPEKVTIDGQTPILVGHTLKLTCFADSEPSANFTWSLNGTEILELSSVLSKNKASYSDSGTYTCNATNNITGKTTSNQKVVFVTDTLPPPPPPTCGPGCIAGIVIAVIILIAAAVGLGYYFIQKRKTTKNSTSSTTRGGAQENTAYASELNYAEVTFHKKKGGETVQLGAQKAETHYAEVQGNNSTRPAASSPPTYNVHMERMKRPAPQPGMGDVPVYSQVRKNQPQ